MNPMEPSLEKLKPLIRCPVCQKKYEPGKVILLSEDDRKTALHLTCESCGISSLVFVSLGKMGAVSFGMLTDLDAGRSETVLRQARRSTADDALEVHRFLKDFRGGHRRLSSDNYL
jgi:hypothetical protein